MDHQVLVLSLKVLFLLQTLVPFHHRLFKLFIELVLLAVKFNTTVAILFFDLYSLMDQLFLVRVTDIFFEHDQKPVDIDFLLKLVNYLHYFARYLLTLLNHLVELDLLIP